MLYSPDQEKQAVKGIVILKQVSKYFSVIHNNLCAKTFCKVCQDLVDILGTFTQAEPLGCEYRPLKEKTSAGGVTMQMGQSRLQNS